MGSLPHELIIEIIKELGNPVDPLAYALPQINIGALGRLCNVSLALKEMVEPILYNRIVITSTNLAAFVRTILEHAEPSGAGMQDDKAGGKLAYIRSLAFYKFRYEVARLHEIEQIISILRVPKPSLERLLLDITYGKHKLSKKTPDLYMAIRVV
ncbi:hypothetical protein FRB94_002087 [Tulasnella sp. JGI-2019a]|nr:hypothetical protein FRB93_012871 [Tulasnella sp. JGI-2019a]KAG9004770.1 hypothetical protein FRB94_002087 [Tulasnella sp. JGI-2019a]KAG9036783.1 hypothetical protein FRB95_007881 [Tulasnella sp. JGI-2019a]